MKRQIAENRQLDYTAEAVDPLRPVRGPQPVVDDAEAKPYLRSAGRVPVRASMLPRNRAGRVFFGLSLAALLVVLAVAGYAGFQFVVEDPHFRINTAGSIQTTGNSLIERSELIDVFGSDIGRNIFYVPLRQRQRDLEQIPWVEHAAVMRLLPDQLRVTVVERKPVAFVRRGNQIGLVDGSGVLLEMTPGLMAARHYSFPVVTGIEDKDPLSTRAARMQIYARLMHELDGGQARLSDQLSEVDLSDPEDVRVLVSEQGSDVLVHLGSEQFLDRFNRYKNQLADWRVKYPHLASVDMRYDQQAVLEMAPGTSTEAAQPSATEQQAAPQTIEKKPEPKPAAKKAALQKSTRGKSALKAAAKRKTSAHVQKVSGGSRR